MIQANELRIGNWVIGIDYFQVEAIFKERDMSMIEPIPLTPEILYKCGFEKDEQATPNIVEFCYGYNPVTHDWTLIIVHFKEQNIFFYRNGYHSLKYVHQIQNLYFAFTGEEIQVSL